MLEPGLLPSLVEMLEVYALGGSGNSLYLYLASSGSRNRAQNLKGEKEQWWWRPTDGSPWLSNLEFLLDVHACSSIAIACEERSCCSAHRCLHYLRWKLNGNPRSHELLPGQFPSYPMLWEDGDKLILPFLSPYWF